MTERNSTTGTKHFILKKLLSFFSIQWWYLICGILSTAFSRHGTTDNMMRLRVVYV